MSQREAEDTCPYLIAAWHHSDGGSCPTCRLDGVAQPTSSLSDVSPSQDSVRPSPRDTVLELGSDLQTAPDLGVNLHATAFGTLKDLPPPQVLLWVPGLVPAVV